MAHSGAARATVEALTRELAERWAASGVSGERRGGRPLRHRGDWPSTPRACARAPRARCRCSAWATPTEHAWLVALLASPLGRAFNGSTVTLDGARDNWFGPWPPPGLADESGEVPVEERRAGSATPVALAGRATASLEARLGGVSAGR